MLDNIKIAKVISFFKINHLSLKKSSAVLLTSTLPHVKLSIALCQCQQRTIPSFEDFFQTFKWKILKTKQNKKQSKASMTYTFISAVGDKEMPSQQFNYFPSAKKKIHFTCFQSNSSHFMLSVHEFQPFKKQDGVTKLLLCRKKITNIKTCFWQKLRFRWLLLDKIIRIFKSNLNNISEKNNQKKPQNKTKEPPKTRKTLGLNIHIHTTSLPSCVIACKEVFLFCGLSALHLPLC